MSKGKLFVTGGPLHLLSRKIIKSFERGSSKRIFTPSLSPLFPTYYQIDMSALINLPQLNLQTEKRIDHQSGQTSSPRSMSGRFE
jgi:hypothetical protein